MSRLMTTVVLCLLAACPSLFAQITVTNNNWAPPPGDSTVYTTYLAVTATDYDSLKAGSGGPMTWDFSQWSSGQSMSYRTYSIDPDSMPAIDSFPDANLVFLTNLGIARTWTAYASSPTEITALGTVTQQSIEAIDVYHDSTADFHFPIHYGDQWTSHHYSKLQATDSSFALVFDTTDYNVTGWGTATYNSHSAPCLRVVVNQRQTTRTYTNDRVETGHTTYQGLEVIFIGEGGRQLASASEPIGFSDYSLTVSSDLMTAPTDVREDPSNTLPEGYALSQNYPNPFNPSTEISLSVPTRSHVRLTVYDILGREVAVLIDRSLGAGNYTADWNGRNSVGNPVASGVYFYRLVTDGATASKRMLLLK